MPYPGHHLSHAASAFFGSGFDRAGVLVVDAYGARIGGRRERETAFLFEVNKAPEKVFQMFRDTTRIAGRNVRGELQVPAEFCGVGELYRMVTLGLGFSECGTSYDDAGKTMGLAAYGKPFSQDPLFIRTGSAGFSFDGARDSLSDLGLIEICNDGGRVTPYTRNEKGRVRREDIAAQIQFEFENACMRLVEDLVGQTGERRVATSGGCFLNTALNTRLLREGVVDELFAFPAATDDGNAIGAALYAHHYLVKAAAAKSSRIRSVYWGPKPPESYQISEIAKRWGANFKHHNCGGDVVRNAAEAIACGEIIGWFQGRSEFGPRALGARSILCHPSIAGMKAKLNRRVKFREPFRPFAASILAEDAADWFELPAPESPFMMLISDVLPEKADQITEVVHVDGTCRLQTVAEDGSERYRGLLRAFKQLTGLPLVLNTSFNLRGMPIVEGPEEALDCLYGARLDRIFCEDVEIVAPDFGKLTPQIVCEVSVIRNAQFIDGPHARLFPLFDGRRSLDEAASEVEVEFDEALDAVLELRHMKLADWRETPARPLPNFIVSQYEAAEM
ncbi:carbamoyltransferase C-terminal domain-containing protein [Roseibium sp. RKSG952]|uniref:carbamoyltransferase C-terminal domain-containing protein n=1 Tax=Roseibium sp. RKSG952 TaxID=2529384 RepID=UPI0018AD2D79|nr:carbamoyltransferase C-terminal domain-containing protein [Roseibium sp. RKSG952]